MTKYQLFNAFLLRQPLVVSGVVFRTLERIEHEDGSCHSFNVTGYDRDGKRATVYVRTID